MFLEYALDTRWSWSWICNAAGGGGGGGRAIALKATNASVDDTVDDTVDGIIRILKVEVTVNQMLFTTYEHYPYLGSI